MNHSRSVSAIYLHQKTIWNITSITSAHKRYGTKMSNYSNRFTGSLPSLVKIRPMLMFTGFLGAGKTTLLRNVLDQLSREELLADVILNDRENARLDKETLRDHAASVAALTGSCVCCEGLDELYEMVVKVSKSPHPVLFIELNGTADPLPLQESFTLLEPKFLLYPRWQVCVIDARYFGKRRRYNQLEQMQLETASHYFISHESELTEPEIAQLKETVQVINPRATHTSSEDLAENISAVIKQNKGRTLSTNLATSKDDETPKSPRLDISLLKPKLDDRHSLAHEFTGCNIVFPSVIKSSHILPWLESLPKSVIRVKALVALDSDPSQRYLYERVGQEVSSNPLPVRTSPQVPCSGIFIGAEIDPDHILQQTKDKLHPDSHFAEPPTS